MGTSDIDPASGTSLRKARGGEKGDGDKKTFVNLHALTFFVVKNELGEMVELVNG
ncbi:MAG: hypothetical protein NWR72_12260 [Bacteroidia bacterium]|nr:hypothetical protein [Bacteroidia bacterium]